MLAVEVTSYGAYMNFYVSTLWMGKELLTGSTDLAICLPLRPARSLGSPDHLQR